MPKADLTLDLECWSDELSPAQLATYEKAEAERLNFVRKLKDLMVTNDGEELFSGNLFSAYQFTGDVQVGVSANATPLGRKSAELKKLHKTETPTRAHKHKIAAVTEDDDDDEDVPLAKRLAKSKEKLQQSKLQQTPKEKKTRAGKSGAEKEKITSPSFRPTELTSIGGLTVGIDIKDEGSKSGPDSKEVTFNKHQGKTFPSLVVLARPSLRVKDSINLERSALDSKVKIVLMLTPAKFTEWLIQQGLLKSEQKCSEHTDNELKLGVYSDGSKFPFSGGYVWISECCPTRFVSVFYGSLFEGAAHPPSYILKLIYHWSCQTNVQNVVQWVKVDNMYIKSIYTWLRAICTLALQKHFKAMGGPGKLVEVGLISLGTTTQDGAQRQLRVEILGVLDHEEKTVRLRAIEPSNEPDRTTRKRFAKILEPLTSWVNADSIIVTDLTTDKDTLHNLGFKNVVQCATTDTSAKHTNATLMDYLRRIVPRMFQNTLSLLSRPMIQQFLDELAWREQYGTFPLQSFDSITNHIAEQTKIIGEETLVQRLFQVATNPFKDWTKTFAEPGSSSGKKKPAIATPARRGRKPAVRDSSPHTKLSEHDVIANTAKVENWSDDAQSNDQARKSRIKPSILRRETPVKRADQTPDIPKKVSTSTIEEIHYGVLGVYNKRENEKVSDLRAKCPICEETFYSNVQLQLNIESHLGNIQQEKAVQCRFCLERFEDDDALDKHELLLHPAETKTVGAHSFSCLICQIRFNTIEALEVHLKKFHLPVELPYKCSACGYRSFSHRDVVQHFYDRHNWQDILQCPFCLLVFKIYSNGKCLKRNIQMYYLHLRKHMVRSKNKKCNKCALIFLSPGSLKFHQLFDHQSFVGHSDLKRLDKDGNLTVHMKAKQKPREDSPDLPYTVVQPLDFKCINAMPDQRCSECDLDLTSDNHIIGVMKCLKCRYHTCCVRTMFEHTATCQSGFNPEINVLIQLDKEMHCVCGFSSWDGNSLARHLSACEHKSAYPSVEAAQENTVKRSMLDMLGLVRKFGSNEITKKSDIAKNS